MFDHRKLHEVEGKEKYCVQVSTRFAPLEDLEKLRENIKFQPKRV
jgi:hypothetical protein